MDITKLFRFVWKDRTVAAITGFLVGSVVVNIWWQGVAGCGVVLLLLAIARRLLQLRRAQEVTPFEDFLRQPDREAMDRLKATNEHFLVFNKVIEIRAHPNLGSRRPLSGLGWSPEEISVKFDQLPFDASKILAQIGGLKAFDPPNGKKFSVVDHSLLGTDTDLALHLKETDYFTILSVIHDLPLARRQEFGSFDPHDNRIPHSLCLHFIVRLADGSIVCLRNEDRKAYARNTWSVSAEEQIKAEDVTTNSPVQTLFRRAVLEEVFGLSDDKVPVDERWTRIEGNVSFIRIWSLFVEEHINNFSLLGFCQLSCKPPELKSVIKKLANEGVGVRDQEGKLFITSQTELECLLMKGNCKTTGLFSGDQVPVGAENLHWTSRYRAFRLLRALKGGPLTTPDNVAAFTGA